MKKTITLMLAIALALSMTACGGGSSTASVSAVTPASSTASTPAPTSSSKPAVDLKNPEYSPEQLAVAEKFSAMTDRFQTLVDKINADENLLKIQVLIDTMNTMIDAANADDALFADPANLTAEVLKDLEEEIVVGHEFLDEMEATVANYAGKKVITVPIEIINMTGVELAGLAMSPANDESWGGNLLDAPLSINGTGVTQMSFTEDTLVWDVQIVDPEGGTMNFMGVDFSEISVEGAKLKLHATEGGYMASFVE